MLAIESRVRGEIAGPYIFGATSYGVIEIDAWAQSLNFADRLIPYPSCIYIF